VIRSILTSPTELRTTILPDDKSFTVTTNFSLTGAVNYVKLINEEPLRLFVVTEGSSVIMYGQDDAIVWSREEALSSVTSTEFLDLPEQKMWTQMVDELDETADESAAETPVVRYLRRLTRHAIELRSFPQWIVSHFAGMYGPTIDDGNAKDKISALEAQSCLLNASESPEILYRDNFGLRKLLISVTASGKVIAQDTTRNGKIVWSRYFESISFREIHVVRAAAVKLPPVIVAVGATLDDIGGTATAFVRLNGLTGENFVSTIPQASEFFEPQILTNIGVDKIMRLPIEDPEERTHLLAIFEAGSGRVYIYPDTFATHTHFIKEFLPSFYFTYQNEQGDLQGYKVLEGFRGSLKTQLVWKLNLPETEIALTLSQPQSNEKVASLGRALGNRNVLYKYLNPHMFAIITKDITNNSMKVRIMDAVKGSILYENIHDDVDTDTNDVHVIQSENWFVYHFWSNGNQPKGYQAVVLELFEGAYENERVER
jgi:hypothetical protein